MLRIQPNEVLQNNTDRINYFICIRFLLRLIRYLFPNGSDSLPFQVHQLESDLLPDPAN